jgi:hypothetical protein
VAPKAAGSECEPRKQRGKGKPFVKGQSGNPGGRSKADADAERDKKAFCRSFADELLPDGRSSLRAVMESIRAEAISGSAPHQKLFLAYTVGEPDANVVLSGSVVTCIERRIVKP